ncbi:hypothetical protein A2U01_0068023, partial [Trifolium medium]|nr:hypothetical protein [Trifolium medium]
LYQPKQSNLYDRSMQLQSEKVWGRRLTEGHQSEGEGDCDPSKICKESLQKLLGRLVSIQR